MSLSVWRGDFARCIRVKALCYRISLEVGYNTPLLGSNPNVCLPLPRRCPGARVSIHDVVA